MNRPVRSPRISVGLECAVAPAGDTTLGVSGGEGGGCSGGLSAAEQVLGECGWRERAGG